MKIIKRLTISILFISIIGIILYTCSSPVAVQGLTVNNDTFNSEAIISSSSGDKTFLEVTVSSTSITLSFKSVTNASATNELGKEVISAPDGTNTISGVYPIVNFQDGAFSGTITFIDESQLKITFQQNNYPYFKMRDVTCKK